MQTRPQLQNPDNATEVHWGRHFASLVIQDCHYPRKWLKERRREVLEH